MPLSQQARTLSVTTPLGEDILLLRAMRGSERLSTLFAYELELISKYDSIQHADLLGQPVTVRLELPDYQTRYFNGIVSRFSHTGFDGSLAIYQATLVPWFWFLTRTSDCRIFQDRTVPDIVKDIFREHGYIDFEEFLVEPHQRWNYCVQYRETDFDFISRLLEQEGIYYFFRHENGNHTLVLTDDYGAHRTIAGYAAIPYYPPDATALRERDHISGWSVAGAVQSGAFIHTDFDDTAPRKQLLTGRLHPHEHARGDLERYDYPGGYTQRDQGDGWVRARIEELHVDYETVQGSGNARGLATGALFTLTKYPRDDQNREYLIVATDYQLQSDVFGSAGTTSTGPVFACTFTALDAQTPYRPPRITPKARVQGPQTAIVVGKAGEEIWTDQYGRVKVQFHWDRYGKSDQHSSCWVRVSHPWAGKNWGAVAIPRIGQEVIVDFLEGDPDRPIITGRVYNGVNKPPYGLPGGAVISGLKSDSTKGGGGYNEYVMDDTKGKELIREHGQYDKDSTIEHDLREHVLHDRSRDVTNNETIQIGNDRAKTVDHDETSHIKHDRSETVDHDERLSIHGQRTESVDKDETITIHGARTETVDQDETITVHRNRTKTVDQDEDIQVGHDRHAFIMNDENLEISRNRNTHIAQNETIHIGHNRKQSIFTNDAVAVGRDYSRTIGANQTTIVGADRTEDIGANKTETIAIAKALNVGAAYQVSVGAAMNTSVGGAKTEEVGLYAMQLVGGDRKVQVEGNAVTRIGAEQAVTIGKDQKVTVKGNREEAVSGSVVLRAGSNLILEAGASITLKVGGGWLVVDQTGVTVSNVPAGKRVVNRASPPQAGMGGTADSQVEKTANKGNGLFSVVLGILGRIWALPNTLLGLAYGGIGMLFGATPVWDGEHGILKFINMPSWMMPSAMSFGHVHLFGPGWHMRRNRFRIPVVKEELLHTAQAEILGPFYLPLHAVSMTASVLTGGGTHANNLLEMGPQHGTGPWPWS